MRLTAQHRIWISEISIRAARAPLVLAVALALVVLLSPLSQAQTYTVLYRFAGGSDGAFPEAALFRDPAGNLYSTTEMGGDLSCGTSGCGTVFKLDTNGTLSVVHAFNGSDGYLPRAGLIRGPQGFYGISWGGGADGFGVVFKLNSAGNEAVLYSLTGTGPDGGLPLGGLIRDAAGNLYGTASSTIRQPATWGTVFKVDATGNGTVLYSFLGKPDGAVPESGLLRDASGNLYGTTNAGGSAGKGTVFQLDASGNETVLYSFKGTNGDGANPIAGLIRDAAGNFYGTTSAGGSAGKGTVFKLDASGSETVLHSFTGNPDGASPYAGLVRDAAGNFYGTTYYGGSGPCNDNVGIGCGILFKLDTSGNLTVLHSFAGGSDGDNPMAGLIRDAQGNLYGTTLSGGNGTQCGVTNGCGTVFNLTP